MPRIIAIITAVIDTSLNTSQLHDILANGLLEYEELGEHKIQDYHIQLVDPTADYVPAAGGPLPHET